MHKDANWKKIAFQWQQFVSNNEEKNLHVIVWSGHKLLLQWYYLNIKYNWIITYVIKD